MCFSLMFTELWIHTGECIMMTFYSGERRHCPQRLSCQRVVKTEIILLMMEYRDSGLTTGQRIDCRVLNALCKVWEGLRMASLIFRAAFREGF